MWCRVKCALRQNSLQQQQQLRAGSEDPPLAVCGASPSPANKVPGQSRPFNNTRAMQARTIPKPTQACAIPIPYHTVHSSQSSKHSGFPNNAICPTNRSTSICVGPASIITNFNLHIIPGNILYKIYILSNTTKQN